MARVSFHEDEQAGVGDSDPWPQHSAGDDHTTQVFPEVASGKLSGWLAGFTAAVVAVLVA